MIQSKTERGFSVIIFSDRYEAECSIQKSSLATEDAIWFGVNNPNPIIMASDAAANGVNTNEVVEWNGEGLPPVGAVCENKFMPSGWKKVKILAHDEGNAVFRMDDGYQESYFGGSVGEFRPIRTPEQIAAEVRQRAIEDLGEWLSTNCSIPTPYLWEAAQKIYGAGYRKFEIVDN